MKKDSGNNLKIQLRFSLSFRLSKLNILKTLVLLEVVFEIISYIFN